MNILQALARAIGSLFGGGKTQPTPSVSTTPRTTTQPTQTAVSRQQAGIGSLVSPAVLGLARSVPIGEVVSGVARSVLPAVAQYGSMLAGLLIPTKQAGGEEEKYVPEIRTDTSNAFLSPTPVSTSQERTTKSTPIQTISRPTPPPTPAPSIGQVTTPAPSQPSSFVSQPGAVNLPSPQTTPQAPTLSLTGAQPIGGGGLPSPATPGTSPIMTPQRLSDIISVLLSSGRTSGLVSVPEGLPLSYILQPRKLLGEELLGR